MDSFKRLVVQARQVYAFSHASILGAGDWALDTATHGLEFMLDKFWDPVHGGWFFTTRLDGAPLDPRKDTYAHAFVLFALAYNARASGEREPLHWATRTLDLMEDRLEDTTHGGFFEAASPSWELLSEPRRQNPHMHLLEAFLALYEVTEESRYRDWARRIADLLRGRFQDEQSGCLGEYFTEDWQPAAGDKGQSTEPGHHFEWVWLLHEYARLMNDESVLENAKALFAFASKHGVDPNDGLCFDEVSRSGEILRDTKRMWPQTEFVKALVARGETDAAKVLLDRVFEAYIKHGHGGWSDHLTREGEVFSKDMPATSIYHITLCLSEVLRTIES